MTLHLTKKNAWIYVAGVGGVFLVGIGFVVPPDKWGLEPWRWIILGLVVLVVAGLTIQLMVQSKEDHEREQKESQRDAKQANIEQNIADIKQLISAGNSVSIPATAYGAGTAIQPMNPPVNFDADAHFKRAYQSAWTADVEKRIKIAASQNKHVMSPEDFYAKLIGTGLVAYTNDIIWAYIWRSQFLMLEELNRHSGIMPIAKVRHFYDQGKIQFPQNYVTYTFDNWLGFMQSHNLVIRHPSDMVEITFGGRDFLSYSAHESRKADQRKG